MENCEKCEGSIFKKIECIESLKEFMDNSKKIIDDFETNQTIKDLKSLKDEINQVEQRLNLIQNPDICVEDFCGTVQELVTKVNNIKEVFTVQSSQIFYRTDCSPNCIPGTYRFNKTYKSIISLEDALSLKAVDAVNFVNEGQQIANLVGTCTNCNATSYFISTNSKRFTRNNCATNCIATDVFFQKKYYSTISQTAADILKNQDLSNFEIEGQNEANTKGECLNCEETTTYSASNTKIFTRNNCSDGCTAGTYTYSKNYTSTVSQAAADNLKTNDLTNFNEEGQSLANLNATCTNCPGECITEWLRDNPIQLKCGNLVSKDVCSKYVREYDKCTPSIERWTFYSADTTCSGCSSSNNYEILNVAYTRLGSRVNNMYWNEMPNVTVPEGYDMGSISGLPICKNEVIDSDGKINIIKKGITYFPVAPTSHQFNYSGSGNVTMNSSSINSDNRGLFLFTYQMMTSEVQNSVNGGSWNYTNWGDPSPFLGTSQPATNAYTSVTEQGFFEMGKRVGISISNFYLIENNWNTYWYAPDFTALIDEEHFNYGIFSRILSFAAGMYEGTNNKANIIIYGTVFDNTFIFNNIDLYQGVPAYLVKYFDAVRLYNDLTNLNNFNSGIRTSSTKYRYTIGQYMRTPYISNVSIYAKDTNGNYILDSNGHRTYKETDVQIELYPGKFATGYANAQNTSIDPYPSGEPYLRPETEWFTHNYYEFIDRNLYEILKLKYAEDGTFDISYNTDRKIVPHYELRVNVEANAFKGNESSLMNTFPRDLGLHAYQYLVWNALLMGVRSIGLYDENFFKNYKESANIGEQWKNYWDPLFPTHPALDEDYTKYYACIQSATPIWNWMQEKVVQDIRFLHFYQPITGNKNYEIVANGMYYGSEALITFTDLNNDVNEVRNFTLYCGSQIFNLSLTGNAPKLIKFTNLPIGLDPINFKLHYTNVNGVAIKVNGKISNNYSAHYE